MIRVLFIAALTLGQSLAASLPAENIQSLREHLIPVGRVGREILRPGVMLGEGDLILTPKIAPVDDQPAAYLVLLDDGRIITAETLENADDANFELLRLPEKIGAGTEALAFSEGDNAAPPFLAASIPLSLLDGEPAQIHLARTPAPKEQDEEQDEEEAEDVEEEEAVEEEDESFLLDLALTRAGHPLFDFQGNLIALTTSFDEETQSISWLSLEEAFRDCPAASALLTPAAPDWEPTRLAAPPELTTPAWLLPVVNAASEDSDGSHAIVIGSSGLLVSKASDLGARPSVRIDDQDYPAAILATDEATDLALLAIEKEGLEVVEWNDSAPVVGTFVNTPVRTTCEPGNLSLLHGIVSHTLPAHPMSPPIYWSAEKVTSLGVVLEQSESQPRVVRLLEDGPAAAAGVKVGDVLMSLAGEPLPDRSALRGVLGQHKVGDELVLTIRRGDQSIELKTRLAAARLRAPALAEGKLSEVPTFQGLPSLRRSGFPETWVHDTPLAPWQLGTPMVDEDGRPFGINIASLGHGRTLTLPASSVRQAIARMKKTPLKF